VDPHTVELDAYDLVDDAVRIRQELRRHKRHEQRMNLTGGTGILTGAALLASLLEGVPCVYVREEEQRELALPFIRMPADRLLHPARRRVLEAVAAAAKPCSQTELGRILKLSKPAVHHHVRQLAAMGLVYHVPTVEDKRHKLLRAADAARLLLDPNEAKPK
jgi:DNA-binding MarR family transcriptional regulator